MTNAIILHGMPRKKDYYDLSGEAMSNKHWLPWLQAQLVKRDIPAATPEIIRPFKPQWDVWVREVERFDIGPETALIGHSTGAGFWVRYLSENKNLRVGKVVLVAPWIDPDKDEAGEFFKFKIDGELASRTKGITIFHSDNDMGNVQKSVAILREEIKDIGYREFHNYGHFRFANMQTHKFPELLEEILG